MSLTSCAKKAGTALDAGDKAAIMAAARKYRADGLSADEAGKQAIRDQIAAVQALMDGVPEPTAEVAESAAEPVKAKETRLTDAGEELIRNRRGKLKGLAWDDVSAMNDTLKVAQVVKANVWPRPDYAKMVEDGAPAWKAALLKAVYDKMAAAPVTRAAPTDADLRAYIETMQQVREALTAEIDRVEGLGGAADLWKTLSARNLFGKVFPVPADARPVYGSPSPFDRNSEQGKENNRRALLIGGNNAVRALQFSSNITSKVKDLLADGFPAKQEAWQKSYEVRQTETRDNDVPEAERTGQPQQRFYVYEKGSRWRLAKGGQDGGYATQELAEAFARSLTVKKREVLPPSRGLDLADVKRTGPDWRAGKDVTAQDIIDRFGFRGVNLGEYVKAKQGMAQIHLNHVFDAFSDLADLLGVPPKAMSLNGALGVAIGAQGSGKALAHFVPGVNEINITRDSGAGALAHEFGHAMDHYFATQHGRAASMAKRPYLSATVESMGDPGGVRPEVMAAMRAVMKSLNSRPMTEAEARKYLADQRELNGRRMDRWVKEFSGNKGADPAALSAVAEKIKRGDIGQPQDGDVETNLAEFMRAAGLKPGNAIAANAFTLAYRLRDLADEATFLSSHIPQVDTDYAKASAAMDAKKQGDGYWSTPWEKFARAFETFAMDALKDRQRESLYLSGLVDSASWQSWAVETGKTIPYPAGAERLEMQQAFQKMVETIQTRTDDAGNVAMFDRTGTPSTANHARITDVAETIAATWANAPEVIVVIDMQDPAVPQKVRDADATQRSQGADGVPAGFFSGGKVYLVSSQISSDEEAAKVLFHEALGHAGLRGVFGSALDKVLDQMAVMRPEPVRAKAKQYGLDFNKLSERRQAAEEVLAELAQDRPTSTWVQRAVAVIKAWLRENVAMFKDLGMSDAEVTAQFIEPARGFIERGRGKAGGEMAFNLNRAAKGLLTGRALERELRKRGEQVASRMDAERRMAAGERVFVGHDMSEGDAPTEAMSVDDLNGYTADQMIALPAAGTMFSRTTGAATAIRDIVPDHMQKWITDRTTSQRGFNRWWHRTVGTQLHKAKVNKDYGRVFYAVQDFMKDVSRMATLASDKAPDMLPQIDSLGDLAKLVPTLANPAAMKRRKADIKAASDALFDGTLRYKRDDEGVAVKVDPESEELGGLVWTDAELKARGVSENGIAMYRQSLEAIGQSLDSMLAADVYRMATVLKPDMLANAPAELDVLLSTMRRAASSDKPGDAIRAMKQAIQDRIDELDTSLDGQPNQYTAGLSAKRDELQEIRVAVDEKVNRIASLKENGYAPLMRFGPYAVDVMEGDKRIFFGLYESQAEANKAARRFKEQGLQTTQSVMSKKEFELLEGLSPETAMLFAEMLGVEKTEAMQAWLKNAVAEQSALKRHIRRKGIEGFDDDGSRVLAAFVTSNSRAASRALHTLHINDLVENVKQGDVKDEALSLVEYVNKPKEEAQAIRSLLFVQYIGGSVASALVNLTQTLVQTFPYLSQYGGPMKAGGRISTAMKLAMGKVTDPELVKALARAESDGVIKPQEVFQLQAEASRSLGSNLYARSALAAWGSMFQLAEQFNRRVAFIAAYNTAKAEKIADPFAFAENAVDETQSVFNKGNRPNWSRGAVGATLFTFKTFTIQYVEFLARLPTRERALALAVIVLLAGIKGIPFADDAEDLLDTIAQRMGYNWTTADRLNQWLENTLGAGWAEIVQQGFGGIPGVPFDVSQRLGMANLLPGTGLLKVSETRKENQVLEVFGVAGSAVRDAMQGEARPLALRNIAKALDMYQTGLYRDSRGRTVTEVSELDAALKAIGLQPAGVAAESRNVSREYEKRNLYTAVKAEITDAWTQARFAEDREGIAKAKEAMRRWNEDNPEARIVIRPETIAARVMQMRRSRTERFIKSTPREIRQQVRAELV